MAPLQGHPPPKSTPGLTIADLLSQIEALRVDFENFKCKHEASSSEASPSPLSSPQAAPTVLPNDPPSPPSSTSSMSMVEESKSHPNHQWLQPILDHRHSPAFIKRIDSSMVPLYSYAMPDNVQQIMAVAYPKASPRYLGVDFNGDLRVSAQCSSEFVTMFITLTESDPQPPPCPLNLPPLGSRSRGHRYLAYKPPHPYSSYTTSPPVVHSASCAFAGVEESTPLACASQRWWQWAVWTVYVVWCLRTFVFASMVRHKDK